MGRGYFLRSVDLTHATLIGAERRTGIMTMMKYYALLGLAGLLLLGGCGGSSSGLIGGGGNPNGSLITGVFAGDLNAPGIGPARVVLSIHADQDKAKGRVIVQRANGSRFAGKIDGFSSFAGTMTIQTTVSTSDGKASKSYQCIVTTTSTTPVAGSVGVTMTNNEGQSTATLNRQADFSGVGSTGAPIPGNINVSGNQFQALIQIQSVGPDGQGGYAIKGNIQSAGGDFAFGNADSGADIYGQNMTIESGGGIVNSTNFVQGQNATAQIYMLGGIINVNLSPG